MAVSLKPLGEQVMVITGATSGIGLATARMAAEAGARLVLAARSGADLEEVARQLDHTGGRVATPPTSAGARTWSGSPTPRCGSSAVSTPG